MDSELYKKASETLDSIESPATTSFSAKKQLLSFFWKRNYSTITSLHELNEADLVETLFKCHLKYKLMGNLLGIFCVSVAWNTIFLKWAPINKFLVSGIVIYYIGETIAWYHIDSFFHPLSEVFNLQYLPLLRD